MRVLKSFAIKLAVLALLTLSPAYVRGELFGDLYVGGAYTRDADAAVSVAGNRFTEHQDLGDSLILGLRIGYWLERRPWLGFSVDYSDFAVSLREKNVFVSPLSGLLMLRVCGMKSADFPKGRIQPYLALGAGIFHSVEKGSYTPPPWGPLVTAGNPGASIDIGVDLRVGLSWSFSRNLAAFCEYRYTRVEPELAGGPFGENVTIETVFRTSHGLAGISYRFD